MQWQSANSHQSQPHTPPQTNIEQVYREQIQRMAFHVRSSIFYNGSSKHVQIRLERWMKELSKYEFNSVWRTNKISYFKLLILMCDSYSLVPPFNNFPTQQLHILQKHEISKIVSALERQIKLRKSKGGELGLKRTKNTLKLQKFSEDTMVRDEDNRDQMRYNEEHNISINQFRKNKEGTMKRSMQFVNFAQKTNLLRSSHPKISPATTICSQAWKATGKSKIFLSKTLKLQIQNSSKIFRQCKQKKQYWQSNSQIGSGTPKYLHHYNGEANVIVSEDEERTTQRSQRFCECISKFWTFASK